MAVQAYAPPFSFGLAQKKTAAPREKKRRLSRQLVPRDKLRQIRELLVRSASGILFVFCRLRLSLAVEAVRRRICQIGQKIRVVDVHSLLLIPRLPLR